MGVRKLSSDSRVTSMFSMRMNGMALLLAAAASVSASALPKRQEAPAANYTLREVGARNTEDWRMWLENNGEPISFWHDVPLYPTEGNASIINFVVEIPRWTNGKIEIQREEPLNPIFHDTNDDGPRFVESVWPHKSYPFLYGSIPQTWESPNFEHNFTNFEGDNDPVDLFDIGQDVGYTGQIKQVKILGCLALNDGNETDWKVLGIDIEDPIAPMVNHYEDVEKYRPGLVKAFRDWFTYYKLARGDGILEIVGDYYQSPDFCVNVIEESHGFWQELVAGEVDSNEINYNQTSNADLESYAQDVAALDIPAEADVQPPAERPSQYDDWFYIKQEYSLVEV